MEFHNVEVALLGTKFLFNVIVTRLAGIPRRFRTLPRDGSSVIERAVLERLEHGTCALSLFSLSAFEI